MFELAREVCALIPEQAAARVVDRNNPVESHSGETAPSLVYLSQFPSSSLLAKCGEGAAPILLLLDDPVDAVRYLRLGLSSPRANAMRFAGIASVPTDRTPVSNPL